jgi:hypothetical protein
MAVARVSQRSALLENTETLFIPEVTRPEICIQKTKYICIKMMDM